MKSTFDQQKQAMLGYSKRPEAQTEPKILTAKHPNHNPK